MTDWRVVRRENGDHEWTTPSGRRYLKRASTYPIDTTALPDRAPF